MSGRGAGFIRPPTLTETVASHIREAIIRGQLVPGSSLREVDLSRSLSISRGTVREALRYLQDENLVDIKPHQGAFVTRLSPQMAWEIYTLRAQLEPYAVRLALEHEAYTRQDFETLDGLVRRLGALEREGEAFERIAADMEFHRVMCERSSHQLLIDALRSLQSLTRLFILNTMLYRSDPVGDEVVHRRILRTLRDGDPARAEDVVRSHIIEAGTALVRSMGSAEPAAPSGPEAEPLSPLDGARIQARPGRASRRARCILPGS